MPDDTAARPQLALTAVRKRLASYAPVSTEAVGPSEETWQELTRLSDALAEEMTSASEPPHTRDRAGDHGEASSPTLKDELTAAMNTVRRLRGQILEGPPIEMFLDHLNSDPGSVESLTGTLAWMLGSLDQWSTESANSLSESRRETLFQGTKGEAGVPPDTLSNHLADEIRPSKLVPAEFDRGEAAFSQSDWERAEDAMTRLASESSLLKKTLRTQRDEGLTLVLSAVRDGLSELRGDERHQVVRGLLMTPWNVDLVMAALPHDERPSILSALVREPSATALTLKWASSHPSRQGRPVHLSPVFVPEVDPGPESPTAMSDGDILDAVIQSCEAEFSVSLELLRMLAKQGERGKIGRLLARCVSEGGPDWRRREQALRSLARHLPDRLVNDAPARLFQYMDILQEEGEVRQSSDPVSPQRVEGILDQAFIGLGEAVQTPHVVEALNVFRTTLATGGKEAATDEGWNVSTVSEHMERYLLPAARSFIPLSTTPEEDRMLWKEATKTLTSILAYAPEEKRRGSRHGLPGMKHFASQEEIRMMAVTEGLALLPELRLKSEMVLSVLARGAEDRAVWEFAYRHLVPRTDLVRERTQQAARTTGTGDITRAGPVL